VSGPHGAGTDQEIQRIGGHVAHAVGPMHGAIDVRAWAAEARLCLGQLAVGDKSNEIVAVPKLLELLSLKGRIVTADAMSCQRKIAQQVIDQGADYVLALKGNQETLHDDVRRFLDDAATPLACATDTDKGHGRIETRTAALTTDIAWLQESHDWPGLKAIGKITARREIDGKTSVETRCYLLSSAFSPERFNAIVRSHWGIENGLHWVLDVVMDEDQARNRKDHGPQNLLLRKLALNLAKLEPSKGSMRGKLKQAGWDNAFLTQILLQFANVQMR
jgi:predicted transposase YbfD/YdcC